MDLFRIKVVKYDRSDKVSVTHDLRLHDEKDANRFYANAIKDALRDEEVAHARIKLEKADTSFPAYLYAVAYNEELPFKLIDETTITSDHKVAVAESTAGGLHNDFNKQSMDWKWYN